ncbi:CobW family GTP-binding protein [Palleronia sp. KMU-117]|uniref:CobW family GTP-binding protein n=1 Tax=Palleronia sp. KMU-117 TaxID=3434108 RepID=UPI003D744FFE
MTVIGGYLGAGKTTLVNRLLAGMTGERVAVIVNDFGAINVDADLIRSEEEHTIRLTNGCMCCSASDGMAAALARLVARAGEIDRIVVETSGVAEPGKVALNAHGFRLPLDGVIVLADAEQLPAQAANRYVGGVVRRQLAQADIIVINKTDLVDAAGLSAVRGLVRTAAPDRPIIQTSNAEAPLLLLFGTDARPAMESSGEPDHAGHGHERVHHTWLFERDAPLSKADVAAMAEDLTGRAVRAKGHVHLVDAPETRHLYQQVGRRWTLVPDGAWGERPPATAVVAIGIVVHGAADVGDRTGNAARPEPSTARPG